MKKIAIVEDDTWIVNSLRLYLENSSFEVFTYYTWDKASDFVLEKKVDIVILDINLPEKDGIEICNEIRKESEVPIIMLTARDNEVDKLLWFKIWADDYVSKPFSPKELLARINSILKRVEWITKTNKIIFKDIVIDLDKITVQKWWETLLFTKSEFDMLKKLIQERWKVVSRDTLMKEIIWYEKYMFDRTIDAHIKNIRRKLKDKDIIKTVRWEWYKINE